MQKRKLGYTDLYLTTIGLGTWAIGGGHWYWGWGPQDESESIATIQRAIDLGINWIDSAAAYGLGRSEELIGKAIAGRRDEVIVATKCGLLWDEDNPTEDVRNWLKADSVRKEAEDSLRRLNIEQIDLYQIHWPFPDEDLEEGWTEIAKLIEEGKVRFAGVCNASLEQLRRLQAIHPVASLQPEYNMFKRGAGEGLIPYCAANEIGVVGYSPLRSGILTDKFGRERMDSMAENDWRRRDPDFQEPRVEINLAAGEKLQDIARSIGQPLSRLAIAWVLANPAVTSAIVGARRPSQIEVSAPAGDLLLPEEVLEQITAVLTERDEALAEAGALGEESLR